MNDYPPLVRYLIRLLFTIAVIFTLIITKTLLVPLFWAVLFAYLLYPAASKFEEDFKKNNSSTFVLYEESYLPINEPSNIETI